jgi:hypothetical protein
MDIVSCLTTVSQKKKELPYNWFWVEFHPIKKGSKLSSVTASSSSQDRTRLLHQLATGLHTLSMFYAPMMIPSYGSTGAPDPTSPDQRRRWLTGPSASHSAWCRPLCPVHYTKGQMPIWTTQQWSADQALGLLKRHGTWRHLINQLVCCVLSPIIDHAWTHLCVSSAWHGTNDRCCCSRGIKRTRFSSLVFL